MRLADLAATRERRASVRALRYFAIVVGVIGHVAVRAQAPGTLDASSRRTARFPTSGPWNSQVRETFCDVSLWANGITPAREHDPAR